MEWPEFPFNQRRLGTRAKGRRLLAGRPMKKDNANFGWVVGGLIALAAALFIFSGGTLGGKITVQSDDDLPPVASAGAN